MQEKSPLEALPQYPLLRYCPHSWQLRLLLLLVYGAFKSCEILMFVCLEKDAKQCCDAAELAYARCAGQRPAQRVQSSSAASKHCLASFWRQTNIKISRDLGVLFIVTGICSRRLLLSLEVGTVGSQRL